MSYVSEVLADSPFRYWKMNDASSPLAENGGGTGITLVGGATCGVAGATTALGNAVSFDGTDDGGTVASLDLSDTAILTIEFWLLWDVFANNDDLAMEFTSNWSNNGSFIIDPNSSGGAFRIGLGSGAAFPESTVVRPSVAWHHYAIELDRSQAGGSEVTGVWIDGSSVTVTPVDSNDTTGNFVNDQLNVMCRNGGSLCGAGDMQHLAIYKTLLSGARIQAHYDARDALDGIPAAVAYLEEVGSRRMSVPALRGPGTDRLTGDNFR